jgi:hypothetical protein
MKLLQQELKPLKLAVLQSLALVKAEKQHNCF